ncbi:MAG TPA: phenylalanine--tRNA ligase subunit beta [candidate division Zixibacteria bacterium]|nr:phenylalanine--tRNA ligase subunit beta [candidate division Zixibacteria bacterium]
MKISYKWLMELTGLDWSVDEVADRLTLCGTACEYVEPTAVYMDKVVVAEVLDLKPIEGADKIRLATVNNGSGTMDVVCGAPNVAKGQKVPLAMLGARLAGDIVIKKAKIRGVESCGMICSERELGLSDDHRGIMVLGEDAIPGTPLVDYLDFDDFQLTFELTPNRPDSMSAIGIARDLAVLAKTTLIKPEINLEESDEKASDYISVEIDDIERCPRYAARVIRGVKVAESPWWIKKKLIIAGMRPINNIVDISNLVMLECGHPLHAFDLDRFGSDKVVVRRAAEGEKFTTLDGEEHLLIDDVLLITNGEDGVAAAGVMGGLNSEVEDDTVNLLLEAAYFDPSMIRRSRRHLGLVTESSQRFEKGADPNGGIDWAVDRAASLFQQLAGGQVLEGVVDCYPEKIERKKINFRPRRCNDILGTTIDPDRMHEIFRLLEFEVEGSDPLEVTVPTFRPDIEKEIDLIEEIVRIDGFDAVPDSHTSIGPLFTPILPIDRFRREIRQIMTASGFDEMLTHGLVHSVLVSKISPDTDPVKITNPSSEDLDVMRTMLLQSGLEVVRHNVSHRNMDLRLFEIGKVYFPGTPDEDDWIEEERLSLLLSGRTEATWRDKPRDLDFYDMAGAVQALSEHFGWSDLRYEPADFGWLDSSLSYKLMLGKAEVGWIGLIDRKAAKAGGVKETVLAAEMKLLPLLEACKGLSEYKPLPIYPAAPRDLAIVVKRTINAGDIVNSVREAAGELAESVEIFDLYQGEQIDKDKKSIALSVTYRSADRSLSHDEVDATQKIVVERLKRDFNAEVRDK